MTTRADNNNNSSMFVYHIESNDVLLGRGAPIINNKGNQSFREVVNTRKAEYMASCRHCIKNSIALEVIQTISSRNGRFLRKVEDREEAQTLGLSFFDKSVWIISDEHVTLQKVKQALREQEAKPTRTTKSVVVMSVEEVVSNKEVHSKESVQKEIDVTPPASTNQIQELIPVQIAEESGTLSYEDLLLQQTQLELEKQVILGEILRRQIKTDAAASKPYNPTYTCFPPSFNMESSPDRIYSQVLGISSPLIASLRISQPNNWVPAMLKPTDIENVNLRELLRFQRQLDASSVNDRVALRIPSIDAAHGYQSRTIPPYIGNNMALNVLKKRQMYDDMFTQQILDHGNIELYTKRQRTHF